MTVFDEVAFVGKRPPDADSLWYAQKTTMEWRNKDGSLAHARHSVTVNRTDADVASLFPPLAPGFQRSHTSRVVDADRDGRTFITFHMLAVDEKVAVKDELGELKAELERRKACGGFRPGDIVQHVLDGRKMVVMEPGDTHLKPKAGMVVVRVSDDSRPCGQIATFAHYELKPLQ